MLCREVIRLAPAHATVGVYTNLGALLMGAGQLEDCLLALHTSIALAKQYQQTDSPLVCQMLTLYSSQSQLLFECSKPLLADSEAAVVSDMDLLSLLLYRCIEALVKFCNIHCCVHAISIFFAAAQVSMLQATGRSINTFSSTWSELSACASVVCLCWTAVLRRTIQPGEGTGHARQRICSC